MTLTDGAGVTPTPGRLAAVSRVVVILSGKGGVGKSYVAAALALAAASRDAKQVALLDPDPLHPAAARMFGVRGPLRRTDLGLELAVGHSGVRVYSADLLPAGTALATLEEVVAAVAWGSLDLLVVDLATGADWIAGLGALPSARTSAILVTTPTDESRAVAERALRAALGARLPMLGIIENMSGYHCGACGETGPLFTGEAGAALAAQFRIPLLGRIPFHAPRRTMEPTRSTATEAASMQDVLDATLQKLL